MIHVFIRVIYFYIIFIFVLFYIYYYLIIHIQQQKNQEELQRNWRIEDLRELILIYKDLYCNPLKGKFNRSISQDIITLVVNNSPHIISQVVQLFSKGNYFVRVTEESFINKQILYYFVSHNFFILQVLPSDYTAYIIL